jgi:hypothetical protein
MRHINSYDTGMREMTIREVNMLFPKVPKKLEGKSPLKFYLRALENLGAIERGPNGEYRLIEEEKN